MRMKLSFIADLLLTGGLAGLLTGCDPSDFGPSDRFTADIHYTLKPTDRLRVENLNGNIEIAGWDESSIDVSGVKYASTEENLNRIRVDVHESPDLTEIRTVRPDTFHGNLGARYLIRVPRKIALDRLVSSNGAIRVENISGDVDAQTSNGSIGIDSVSGKLRLRSSNGKIRASDATGQSDAETSNGAVTLQFKDSPEGPVRVTTNNGSVDLTMSKPPKDGIRVETSNSSITLDLPSDTAARLNAETSHGSVSSDFDVAGLRRSDSDRRKLEGSIGAGGPLIELTTSNGAIRVRKSVSGGN
jgi:hypothetical protein